MKRIQSQDDSTHSNKNMQCHSPRNLRAAGLPSNRQLAFRL